jgi:sugar lactone lactonase YvrE
MNCYCKGEYAMLHTDEPALRLLPSSFLFRAAARIVFKTFIAACAIAMGVGLLGGLPLEAQTVASFWEAQTVPFNSKTNGTNFQPMGLAVDTSGNLYIMDGGNSQVLKETLQPGGSYTQSVVANGTNNGINGPETVAVDSSGNVYIADTGNNRVLMETLQSGGSYTQSVVADSSSSPYPLDSPMGVAVDSSGNVYIADTFNARVLKETPSSGSYTQSVVANTSSSPYPLEYPMGVAVDSSGNVYIADGDYDYVVKETPPAVSGNPYTQTLVADISAPYLLEAPQWIAVDGSGNVYITDFASCEVLKETPSGGSYTQSLVANRTYNGLVQPSGVAVDGNGNVYISDIPNTRIMKEMMNSVDFGSLGVGGTSSTIPLMFSFNSADSLNSTAPYQVLTMGASSQDFAAAGTGNTCSAGGAYTADQVCTVNVTFAPLDAGTRDGAVALIDAGGNPIATAYLHGTGQAPQITYSPGTQSVVADNGNNGLNSPISAAVDGSGNVYIADTNNSRVLKETLSGGSYAQSAVSTSPLSSPFGVAVDGAGNVYIADTGNDRILKETWSGAGYTETEVTTSGLSCPAGVAVDGAGNVYIVDTCANGVLKETLSGGTYTQSVVPTSALSGPYGVTVDGAGNVYISDTNNNRVLKETWSGASYTETVVATDGLAYPKDVAVDGSGNVYIADTGNNRVLKETLSGGLYTQSVVADGSATYGLTGPAGVAVDGSGNVYIADTLNSRVLEEDLADPPSLSFGSVNAGSASTAQSVEIINNGNAMLTASSPLSIPSGFTQVVGSGIPADCPASFSLDVGTACNLSIEFTPASGSSGSVSGYVVLTDNNLNSNPGTQSIALSGVVNAPQVAPTITSGSSATFTVGTAGTFTVTATGYPAATFSETGALPSGVTLNATTGVLSGTPAAGTGGIYSLTLTASNGIGTNATQSFTLTIDQAPTITSASSATFAGGTAGTFTVTATGYPASTFSETGTLPSGVILNATTGVLSGSPAAGTGGTYSLTLTASNGIGTNATQSFTLTIDQAPAITSASSATFTVGTAGTFTVTATGYPAPTLSETGTLPSGITFNAPTGVLSGTPAAGTGGTYNLTFTASNGTPTNATQSFTLTVDQAPAITSAASTIFTVGAAGTLMVTASGYPTASLSESGALPSGVSFTNNGNGTATLAGTPASGAAGSYPITFTASNGVNPIATQSFTLTVQNAPTAITLSPSSLPAGTVGSRYSQTLTASGGTAPYTYSVTSGALPSGLTLTLAGVLSGTPTAGGSFSFTIQAKDKNGNTGTQAYTLIINAPTITLSPTSLTAGTVGRSYYQTLTASGGTSPYTYSVTSGALPDGMSLASGGVLYGTPTAGGSFGFTIQAKDAKGFTGSRAYTLTINAPTITLSPASLTAGTVGRSYYQTLTASGGTTPYTYSVTSGSLPAGLTLTTAGVLSGTPKAGGSFGVTIQAKDAKGFTGSQAYRLVINAPTIALSPTSLSAGTVGRSYRQTLTASGGTSPYNYSVTRGALPAGLTLSTAGVLSGTPSARGTASFKVTARDSSTGTGPYTGSQAYTLVVK